MTLTLHFEGQNYILFPLADYVVVDIVNAY